MRYTKMPSEANYTLPGVTSRGIACWVVSAAYAYSYRWNSRRLENHFLWNVGLGPH